MEEEMKEGSSCRWGWCSTLKGYHLCKQFAKITETMKREIQKGEFNSFSHPAPIPDIEFSSSENFEYFESTTLASQQLLEALRNDSVYMIGLYGMGGCGKTTLAKEAGKKAKELKLFNHVVITAVSQTISVRRIQGEIADMLNFKFKSKTEVGKARELSLRLQSGERILIILDDGQRLNWKVLEFLCLKITMTTSFS
ncbi:hypothetical protein L6164_016587 [Bauhinia variegata]|uniref:Uncharacterized protein n=1 Tax=Bauhinia variegata TaxID=167791 RepID=A0ACB9NS58_BAUVA|nr:hypothetical protein L6164_016587 [Bauhinia variegata]